MILNIFVILIISLIFPGIIALTKAKIVGRKGASLLQPLYDNIRLFKKGNVFSETTSWIFQIAPIIYFSTIIAALLFIPLGSNAAVLSFEGDFVLFAYLLAFGKFMMILAAMDTGACRKWFDPRDTGRLGRPRRKYPEMDGKHGDNQHAFQHPERCPRAA